MWDDILDLILIIFDDIIDFFRHGWKARKERKKQQEEATGRSRRKTAKSRQRTTFVKENV